MKKILVPIDFSVHSQNALEVAATLSKRFDAQLILFHMIGISESVLSKSELEEQEEAKYYLKLARDKLSSFIDQPYLKGLTLTSIVQNLKDFSEIAEVANEKEVDLIVMGSHGTSGVKSFFVGSNTEKVVRTSTIPVLVIKEKRTTFNIEHMLFATDLEKESALAYQRVADFAEKMQAKLTLVYINTIGTTFRSHAQILEKVETFHKILGAKVPVEIYNDYSIEEGIYSFAKRMNIDLAAVPTHGRKGLAHFFLGSISERLANTAKLPVLTLKIQSIE